MSAHLDIKHLKMIHTIAKCETVKKAADALFISQPALSSRIKEAERRLNCRLFVRRGRKLVLSRAGERLLHSASRIIEELERAERDIQRHSVGIEQVLRISLPQFSSFKWMPEGIRKFSKQYPTIELEITAQKNIDPLQSIVRGDVDVAVVPNFDPETQLNANLFSSTHLFQDEMVALMAIDHPRSRQKFLSAEDFLYETYITISTVPERAREYELLFKPAGVTPHKVIQVGFIDAIFELVQAGMGVTIMNRWVLESLGSHYKFKALPITDSGLKVDWHCVYVNDKAIADPALYICQFLHLLSK